MPASRRAWAIILAPRSWPSKPALATKTLILFSLNCFRLLEVLKAIPVADIRRILHEEYRKSLRE